MADGMLGCRPGVIPGSMVTIDASAVHSPCFSSGTRQLLNSSGSRPRAVAEDLDDIASQLA